MTKLELCTYYIRHSKETGWIRLFPIIKGEESKQRTKWPLNTSTSESLNFIPSYSTIFSPSAHLPWQRHAIWSRFYLVTGPLMWWWCLFSIKECEWHIRLSPGDGKAHSGTDAIEGDSVHAATGWSEHLEGTRRHQGEHAFSRNLNRGELELRHCPLLHRQETASL